VATLHAPRVLGYLEIIRKPVAGIIPISLLFKQNAQVLGLREHDVTGATDLISRCLRVNPADRPTAIRLLRESSWLQELGNDF
jgi:serine/threonine protein kinase